jgi:hypothetical protein
LYEGLYCVRGQTENHIKALKNHFAADRTSCHQAESQPVPPVPARWRLLASVVDPQPHSQTLRSGASCSSTPCELRLIKFAARVIELKTQIKIHLPSLEQDLPGLARPQCDGRA